MNTILIKRSIEFEYFYRSPDVLIYVLALWSILFLLLNFYAVIVDARQKNLLSETPQWIKTGRDGRN